MARSGLPLDEAQEALVRSLQALIDGLPHDGAPPAVFGHMRVQGGSGKARDLLLGNHTLTGAASRAMVLDWRTAPLAQVYFRYQPGDEYDIDVDGRTIEGTLQGRHPLRVVGSELVEVETAAALLVRAGDGSWSAVTRGEPVAPPIAPGTHRADLPVLDAEQRAAVELPANVSLVVEGEAGVGKTLVALHRLAHLRRAAHDEGRAFSAAVLVPSEGLRRLCRQLAERLGLDGLEIGTVDEWLLDRGYQAFEKLPTRLGQDASAAVIRAKRHPAVRSVLGELRVFRPVLGEKDRPLPAPRADLLHLWGDRERLDRIAAAAGGALSPGDLDAVVAHTQVQFTATTEETLRDVDPERLATADGRAIEDGTPLEDAGTFDAEDVPALFALARERGESPAAALASYDHLVVDEAQLIAPMELAAIGDAVRGRGGTVTLAGDHRQDTDDSAWFAGWDAALAEVGADKAARVTLAVGYRSVPAIASFARRLAEAPPAVVPPGEPALWATAFATDFHMVAAVGEAIDQAVRRAPGATIAVIARNPVHARRLHRELSRSVDLSLVVAGAFTFQPGVVVTHAADVQGLEFDGVVVPDVAPGFYPATPEVQRLLYVAVTRARDWLWLTTSEHWSPLVSVG
jgi:DNA helicase-2/ATP-dependent DNA helicase PcrA